MANSGGPTTHIISTGNPAPPYGYPSNPAPPYGYVSNQPPAANNPTMSYLNSPGGYEEATKPQISFIG